MKAYLLLPFFEKSLTKRFVAGIAAKYIESGGKTVLRNRYFRLTVIATDEKGVYFEGWSGSASNTDSSRYHGTTYVDLEHLTSIVQAQMIAAEQLPAIFNQAKYTERLP